MREEKCGILMFPLITCYSYESSHSIMHIAQNSYTNGMKDQLQLAPYSTLGCLSIPQLMVIKKWVIIGAPHF